MLVLLVGASTLALAVPARAVATAPDLGTARSFGVLGYSAVTNTGPTTVYGSVGVSPGTSVTGFPPGVTTGAIHPNDAVAAGAQVDATAAYNNAAGQACDVDLSGQNLGGMTLTPGVYCFSSSAQLTGQLTLDGGAGSVFVFRIGSTLTTATGAQVTLINGVEPCDVFWQVGSSATLATATDFQGNILALTSITLNTGTSTSGGLYALNGAVTLDTNEIESCYLQAAPTSTPTTAGAATSTATLTALPSTSTATPLATDTPRATNTPSATNSPVLVPTGTSVPAATGTPTPTPRNTRAPADTPEPEDTEVPTSVATDTPSDTALPNNTPSASDTATTTPSGTITLATPAATVTGTALSTETPGGPSATPTAPLPGDTPTQTPVAPTELATPPAALTETPFAPGNTPEAAVSAVPPPPAFLPPTGGHTGGDLPWLDSAVPLLTALLLALGLKLTVRRRFRVKRNS